MTDVRALPRLGYELAAHDCPGAWGLTGIFRRACLTALHNPYRSAKAGTA